MDETTYLNTDGLIVTSTRIDISGQTFAVRNIASVKVTQPGRPWFAILVAIVGASMASQELTRGFGLAILGGAAFWIYQQLRTRRLVLVSSGGETVALKSTNAARIETLRAAIAQAIATR